MLGFKGAQYLDLIRGNALSRHEGPIRSDGELGRLFTNSTAPCQIVDPRLNRKITIEKTGSFGTAVWNPWHETANKMADLGPDGWSDLVCVEGANALENAIMLGALKSHTHTAVYSVSVNE